MVVLLVQKQFETPQETLLLNYSTSLDHEIYPHAQPDFFDSKSAMLEQVQPPNHETLPLH